jgi:hypothetical protein
MLAFALAFIESNPPPIGHPSDIHPPFVIRNRLHCGRMRMLQVVIACEESMMAKLNETELKRVIKGGETNTVELKVAAPRAAEMAERLCGLANAQGGMVIIGVEDASREIVGVAENRIGETLDVVLRESEGTYFSCGRISWFFAARL